MAIAFPDRRRLYERLTLILIDIPAGLIAVSLILAFSCLVFWIAMIETLGWGFIPPLAHFSFVFGGMALMMISKLSRRIVGAILFIAVGMAIIMFGMWSGTLDGSIMDTSFEIGDSVGLMLVGVVTGVFIGISCKVIIELSDSNKRDIQVLLSKNIWYWVESPLTNMFFSGFLVGLTVLTLKDIFYFASFSIAIGVVSGILAGFAFGGLELFHYIIARCVFRSVPA